MNPFLLLALATCAAEAPTQRRREREPHAPPLPRPPLTPQERNALQEREERMARWRHEQDERERLAEQHRRDAEQRRRDAEHARLMASEAKCAAAEAKRARRAERNRGLEVPR